MPVCVLAAVIAMLHQVSSGVSSGISYISGDAFVGWAALQEHSEQERVRLL